MQEIIQRSFRDYSRKFHTHVTQRGAADDGKRASSAIEVAVQAARPLGVGSEGGGFGKGKRIPSDDGKPGPWGGSLGEGGSGEAGGGDEDDGKRACRDWS